MRRNIQFPASRQTGRPGAVPQDIRERENSITKAGGLNKSSDRKGTGRKPGPLSRCQKYRRQSVSIPLRIEG